MSYTRKRSFAEDLSIKLRLDANKRQKVDPKFSYRGIIAKNVRSDPKVKSIKEKIDPRTKRNSEATSGRGWSIDDNGKNGISINGENRRRSFHTDYRGKEGGREYKSDKRDMMKGGETKRVSDVKDKDRYAKKVGYRRSDEKEWYIQL